MRSNAVNIVIDHLVRDEQFAARVRAEGEAAVAAFGLTAAQARAVVAALADDDRAAEDGRTATALRELAHFEPLFASYSATATKKG